MSKKIVLFSLQTFSDTGGIQKMTRTLSHSLHNICSRKHWDFKFVSLYDKDADLMDQYIPAGSFKGFARKKIRFMLQGVLFAEKPDVVILSHINLAAVGVLIKFFSPKTKIWLVAHGIEMWCPLSPLKRKLLEKSDKILCVSRFTLSQITNRHHLTTDKCEVLNNVLDPFMQLPADLVKPDYLLHRYGIKETDQVILSLTRLSSFEQYKGHEKVIKAVAKLKEKYQNLKYILAGRYDELEEERIKQLALKYNIQDRVILTGFIDDKEISDHFLIADLFVLPSKKEGFGIVFIEALACGLPVICGNADGSVDAVRDGELGIAIDPDNEKELEHAIADYLDKPLTNAKRRDLQQECLTHFNERNYSKKIESMLSND
ncbi:glycosyltransferase family 4 protein [Mucilaginibacter sp. 21P]|uniref:glycosyltransferase family 4 protein n=1 Tax=Mucilaginibacter sp. 21P TaxID=2778902 RepID=UPI001C55CB8E|nr:glycosyltransferase family 4 protein [Mucilaginibacter sp. 21P]QXV67089.1 glycosyltransferase family 4 protein [Mucilaginibacter sp. 21P]